MDSNIMAMFNPWWTSGTVKTDLLEAYRRPLFNEIKDYLEDRQIILLYGLRRVGKTTLLYQIVDHLLGVGIEANRIMYFSFDETSGDIRDVLKSYEAKVLRKPIEELERVYIFFDEIQKVEDWDNKLKMIYDQYPNLKFFICGSASLNLRKRGGENLAGRTYMFHLEPLSFSEYLDLKDVEIKFENWEFHAEKIMPYFWDYIRKGGFPELMNVESEKKVREYLRHSVIDRITHNDIPSEFGLHDTELLTILVEWICRDPGMIINVDSLAKQLGRNRLTIGNYLSYLQYALLIRFVKNLRPNFLSSSRKMKKAYPSSTGFPYAFFNDVDEGKILENFISQALGADHYYRNKGDEIDFIITRGKDHIPIEVKSGHRELGKFIRNLKKLNLTFGIIASMNQYDEISQDGILIRVIPAWALALFKDELVKGPE